MLERIYNRILRPRLPYKISVRNGVAVPHDVRLFDQTDVIPDHEASAITTLRKHVTFGDTVVVGGGKGVSTVVAANYAKPTGSVVTYEAAAEQVGIATDTISLNEVSDYCTLSHAIVGSSVKVDGDASEADRVSPTDLPACDVLELDCEGAELDILRNLSIRPRTIIVETHAFLDSPESDVRAVLERLGYDVVDRQTEVESKGVYVLTGMGTES